MRPYPVRNLSAPLQTHRTAGKYRHYSAVMLSEPGQWLLYTLDELHLLLAVSDLEFVEITEHLVHLSDNRRVFLLGQMRQIPDREIMIMQHALEIRWSTDVCYRHGRRSAILSSCKVDQIRPG